MRQGFLAQPERLADQAFDPIAVVGAAHFFARDGDSQSRESQSILNPINDEKSVRRRFLSVESTTKYQGFIDAFMFSERGPRDRRQCNVSRGRVGPRNLGKGDVSRRRLTFADQLPTPDDMPDQKTSHNTNREDADADQARNGAADPTLCPGTFQDLLQTARFGGGHRCGRSISGYFTRDPDEDSADFARRTHE